MQILRVLVMLVATTAAATFARAGEFDQPWRSSNTALVIDAYEYTKLDWAKLTRNKRLIGIINKASDGRPPRYGCQKQKLCRALWKRYAAARELYHTRRHLAKALGFKWGAYHLARPGNPIQQAQHFLRFADPDKDDLLALDIEDNDPSKWMSLKDAETFARYIKTRIGRYPMLYTNHSTAKYIARNAERYPLLARLDLWYARYKRDVRGAFPMGNWPSYTMWQFSSQVNCSKKSCPKRLVGTTDRIDINVITATPEEAKARWPYGALAPIRKPKPEPAELMASAKAAVEGVDPEPKAQAGAPVAAGATPRTEVDTAYASARRGFQGAMQPRSTETLDEVLDRQRRRFPWYRMARTRLLSDEVRGESMRLAGLRRRVAALTQRADTDPVTTASIREAKPAQLPLGVFTGRGRKAPAFLLSRSAGEERAVWVMQATFLR